MEEHVYICETNHNNNNSLDDLDTLVLENINENIFNSDKIISEIVNMNDNFLKDPRLYTNKNIIIYPHLSFSLLDGGTTVQYYLAKILDYMDVNIKICNVHDNNKKNVLFNKFITLDEIKSQVDFENTIVIYCEGIIGNPLNAKYVVRWLLSKIGQNVPLDYLNTWNNDELVYFFNSDNTLHNYEHVKYLSLFYIHPYIQNFNRERKGVCFTRRKNIYPTKDVHSKNSFEIKRHHNQKDYIKIFNTYQFFISYDPLTFLSIIASLCGCISIVYPIEGVSKKDYFKKTAFYDYMKENNVEYIYGIAYGNTLTEINYARQTMHLLKQQLHDIQLWFIEKYIKNFLHDINNWESNKNNLDNYKDNFVNYIKNTIDVDWDFYKSYHKDFAYLNMQQVVLHYLSWGKNEGRVTTQKQLQELQASSGLSDFDLEFYRTHYNDLNLLHGIKLIQHYKDWGKKEGRITSEKQLTELIMSIKEPGFDIIFYKTYHSDLTHLFECHLIQHYKEYGKNEGRLINQMQLDELLAYTGEFDNDIKIQINKNKLNELIASIGESDFDVKFYRTRYNDLNKLNLRNLIQHYKEFGKKEGRVASKKQLDKLIASTGEPDFDVKFYGTYYSDLNGFFEGELIRHYNGWGKREGRYFSENQLDPNNEYFIKKYKKISEPLIYKNLQVSQLLEHIENVESELISEINNKINNIKYYNKDIYLDKTTDTKINTLYVNWFYNLIKNKEMTIISPIDNKLICTDKYFILCNAKYETTRYSVSNYYFDKEQIILGLGLGAGNHPQEACILYVYCIQENIVYYDWLNYSFENFKKNIVLRIHYILNIKFKNYNFTNMDSKVITTYGLCNNMGHMLFNEYTGLYLIDYHNFMCKIDEVIFGPHDVYYVKDYFKKFNNIKLKYIKNINNLNYIIGKGVIFKYNHHFITNKCIRFLEKNLLDFYSINDNYKFEYKNIELEAEIIKKSYYPIINIVLRKGDYEMNNQAITISNLINMISKKYPKAFFYFDGFVKNTLENVDTYIGLNYNQNTCDIIKNYNELVDKIKEKIITNNYFSLINTNILYLITHIKNSNYAIYTVSSASCNGGWICKIPGIQFGRSNVAIYKWMDKIIREDFLDINYFYDNSKITFDKEGNFHINAETIFDLLPNFVIDEK
jgi:hypothetical protein